MCGRVAQHQSIHEFVKAIGEWPGPDQFRLTLAPLGQYNIPPTQPIAVLHAAGETLLADLLPWGWKPHWADKHPNQNARAEGVATSKYWRDAWPNRAIIPIDGWFEWVDEGGPKKQPYYIKRRDGRPTLCAAIGQFPGLDGQVSPGNGSAVITADSLGGMVDVHDRRPVALPPELAREWLDGATPQERAEQMVLHQGEHSDEFEWFRVNASVGNPRNQGKQLIEPIG